MNNTRRDAIHRVSTQPSKVTIGKFGSVFGIHGEIRVYSYTDPIENILNYSPWYINHQQPITILQSRIHGKQIVVKIAGVNDRDLAATYTNKIISIERSQLPETEKGEYYWLDLEGLKVVNLQGENLGIVDHLIATGSNDVLVVKGKKEILIPYLDTVIVKVELDKKVITADWQNEI